MRLNLKYGKRNKSIHIPDQSDVSILKPNSLPELPDINLALNMALNNLINMPKLVSSPNPRSVSVAIPDESRPTPSRELIPILLDWLYDKFPNLKPNQITVIVGGGLHKPMDEAALEKFLPADIAPGCRLLVHDTYSSQMVSYGSTRRGTPVEVNAEYAKADFKLLIGQIDPHQFVGFTGGAKGVVIGCASPNSISHNHGLMLQDGAEVGRLNGNPVREDMNEAGRMVNLNMAVNVVLDADDRLIGMWAGEPVAVLKEGANLCAEAYGVSISRQFDIAIVSCGGYPRDICLYQAQKGLNLASRVVKQKGKILLLAECSLGVGDENYYEYVCRYETAEAAKIAFKSKKFRMGAHKSYLFGKTLTKYEVVVDSDLPENVLRNCHMSKCNAQEIINQWLEDPSDCPSIAVVPNANITYFYQDRPIGGITDN